MWWNLEGLNTLREELNLLSTEEILDRASFLISNSVKSQLISDVPLGAFLSGGIDSSLIVALMKLHQSDTKTITIGFDFNTFDESRIAKKVSENL